MFLITRIEIKNIFATSVRLTGANVCPVLLPVLLQLNLINRSLMIVLTEVAESVIFLYRQHSATVPDSGANGHVIRRPLHCFHYTQTETFFFCLLLCDVNFSTAFAFR